MIVVKIELWPRGLQVGAEEIGRMYIANNGEGTNDRGDYKVAVCRRGTDKVPREIYDEGDVAMIEEGLGKKLPKAARAGEVKDYPRLAYNVWRLIARAVLSAFPEEDRAGLTQKHATVFDRLVAGGFHALAEPLRHALRMPNAPPLPEGELGESIRAALDWLDAARRDDA